jgi:ABC-2 type transport system permease protein
MSSCITPAKFSNLEAAIVTLHEPGALRDDLASSAAVAVPASTARGRAPQATPGAAALDFFKKTLTIAEWEVRKLRHDPTDIITRTVQPMLWLLVFGEVFTRIRAIPTGYPSYLDFLAPGILAQSVLGKALSAGARALPQAAIIYVLALLLGVHMNWNPLALLGVVVVVMLGAACFSTFSILIACLLRSRERVMGIGQVLTMPLFFASNAIYNISLMPSWLQVVARLNPLSYMVDALRAMMLAGGHSTVGFGADFAVLLTTGVALVALTAHFYPRVIQ